MKYNFPRSFVAVFAALLALASCSPNDDVPSLPGNENGDDVYLYGWTESDPNQPAGEIRLNKVEYNPNQIISGIVQFVDKTEAGKRYTSEKFIYLDKKLVKRELYDQHDVRIDYIDYEYKDNRLFRTISYGFDANSRWYLSHIDTFQYNASGQLAGNLVFVPGGDSYEAARYVFEYSWVNGNATEMKHYRWEGDQRILTGYFKFLYGGVPNFYGQWFKNNLLAMRYGVPGIDIHYLSHDLCTERVNLHVQAYAADSTHFVYAFDENGLPKTRTETYKSVTQSGTYGWSLRHTFEFRKRVQ